MFVIQLLYFWFKFAKKTAEPGNYYCPQVGQIVFLRLCSFEPLYAEFILFLVNLWI